MKESKPNQTEYGITLVALVFTVVILAILAALAIKDITGDEGIISVTETATEDYTVIQYKEELLQVTQNTIIAYSAIRKRSKLKRHSR